MDNNVWHWQAKCISFRMGLPVFSLNDSTRARQTLELSSYSVQSLWSVKLPKGRFFPIPGLNLFIRAPGPNFPTTQSPFCATFGQTKCARRRVDYFLSAVASEMGLSIVSLCSYFAWRPLVALIEYCTTLTQTYKSIPDVQMQFDLNKVMVRFMVRAGYNCSFLPPGKLNIFDMTIDFKR